MTECSSCGATHVELRRVNDGCGPVPPHITCEECFPWNNDSGACFDDMPLESPMTDLTHANALATEIKRAQAKRELWLHYQREADFNKIWPRVVLGPALMKMKMAIDEGVDALASGDVVRMLRAHAELENINDDD